MKSSPEAFIWPPPYTVKRHPRARHVRLRASAIRGLEITLPLRFNAERIPEVLEANRDWIMKQLARMATSPSEAGLPKSVSILGVKWQIEYSPGTKTMLHKVPEQQIILMSTNLSDESRCLRKLAIWLRQQAEVFLSRQLQVISAEINIAYNDWSVRAQKTLWGSCTRQKKINLNYRLYFLPLPVVRYVIIHELCHTIHMNHSAKFWQLVASFDTNWKQHRKILKSTGQYLPKWLL